MLEMLHKKCLHAGPPTAADHIVKWLDSKFQYSNTTSEEIRIQKLPYRDTSPQDHEHGASASRGVPVYAPAFAGLIAPTHKGMARLSWPEWLIAYRDGLTIC